MLAPVIELVAVTTAVFTDELACKEPTKPTPEIAMVGELSPVLA